MLLSQVKTSALSPSDRLRPVIALVLIGLELISAALCYQLLVSFECQAGDYETACRGLRSLGLRGLSVAAMLTVFFWLRPKSLGLLANTAQAQPGRHLWLALHLGGVALAMTPALVFSTADFTASIGRALVMMGMGGVVAAGGLMLWVTSAPGWVRWLRSERLYLPGALLAAVFIPDLADFTGLLWSVSALTQFTFVLVEQMLILWGETVVTDAARMAISIGEFGVIIASQCSGVEGFALITIFLGVYAVLMRGHLRPARFWLVLFPAALATSWLLNIVRIALLVRIGAHISPEHAANGFHSFAGWLLFTLLALAILAVAQGVRWFHTINPDGAVIPATHEPLFLLIVPFIAMMVSGIAAAAFWTEPEIGYPLRAAIMAVVLVWFIRPLQALEWRFDSVALGAGLIVGAAWILSGPSALPGQGTVAERMLAIGGLLPAIWLVARLAGTIVMVPVIEELFFRGYVLARLDTGAWPMRFAALAVSSILFGALHDRWIAGALSGLVFGLVMLRRGRVSDAIIAHMAANGAIVAWAAFTSQWHLI
jgi:exosortase E/protease (VPEID-CTERM system)